MKYKFTLVLLAILIGPMISRAYDEYNIHPTINENALSQSNLDEYLKNRLGFSKGIKEVFNNKRVEEWIREGGTEEDVPFSRGNNHFHDPTKAWNEAGLNTLLITGDSSIIWAQKTDQGYTDSDGNYVPFGGTWSWPKARDYYYLGLTATTKEVREQNLANTFKTVGHIMHLVSDVSVPAHTRNDAHLFPEPYEAYTRTALLQYNGYATVNFPKLTDFWDGEHGKGLSEFTNANFYSRDTNKNSTEYANPQVLSESQEFLEEVTDADGNKEIVTVRYGLGTVTDSYSIIFYTDVKLTAYSLWDFDYKQKMGSEVYSLNDTIHQTYADFLIPRAVGYSAGLVNYFFRGNIDFVADLNTLGAYVIKNLGTEDITGTFTLYYDAVDGTRQLVPGDPWSNVEIKSGMQSSPVTFTTPTNPVPKTPGEYFLVFNGKMGQEEPAGGSIGAVAGEYISCTQKTYISDYQAFLFSGNSSYESLPYAWITHASDGSYTLNGYLWILKNPIPLPELRCFPIPLYGCYWYLYYPASPYANNYDPSGDRYMPELTSPEEFVKVWIDLNGDKIFADDEMVYEGQFSPFVADWYTNQLITVEQPLNISAKGYCQTVMRVALRWGAPPSGPYDTWDYGDVQDFQIDLK